MVVNMRKERTVLFFEYSSFIISFVYYFRKLNDAFPLKKLGHLKRVRCVKTEKGGIYDMLFYEKTELFGFISYLTKLIHEFSCKKEK